MLPGWYRGTALRHASPQPKGTQRKNERSALKEACSKRGLQDRWFVGDVDRLDNRDRLGKE